jgi:hypothetical protein
MFRRNPDIGNGHCNGIWGLLKAFYHKIVQYWYLDCPGTSKSRILSIFFCFSLASYSSDCDILTPHFSAQLSIRMSTLSLLNSEKRACPSVTNSLRTQCPKTFALVLSPFHLQAYQSLCKKPANLAVSSRNQQTLLSALSGFTKV